jgi:dipeptidyl aminopeptidase/acylaminoacyl peptidase
MFRSSRLVALACLACWTAATAFADAPALAAPESLVLDGLPPVPVTIAERASRYAEFRSATVLDWHPTHRELIVATRFGDTNQVHRVSMPGGARTQLTFYPDRISGATFQPPRGDRFVFSKDVGGGEWYQLYRYDLASGETTLLTDGKSRNQLGPFSNRGDRLAYGSTRRNGTDVDFYVVDPGDPHSDRRISENQGGGWHIADWSPDDRTLLATEYLSINESRIWLVDVASGRKTPVGPAREEKVSQTAVGFGRDGRSVYLTTDEGSEFQRLVQVDLASGRRTELARFDWDVEEAHLSYDRRHVAFAVNVDGASTLHVLDLATRKERKLQAIPTGVITSLRWHRDSRRLAFTLSSSSSPADAYSVELATGKVVRWTFSETGGLDAAKFARPELVTWRSFDGRTISGYVYRPDPKRFPGRRPVMLAIHGGPEAQFRPTYLGRSNYYPSELGVALLFPNVRGSNGYGKTFVALDNDMKREDSYRDVETLIAWIGSDPGLDPSRILVTGGSYGGHMTLAVATRYDDRICCSVDIVGMSNLVTFLEHTESYRRDLRRAEYGDERDPEMRAFLERIAPLNHVGRVTKPMFVIQGQNDPRVPKSEADQMVASLKQHGTPVWYLVGKDEGHGFAKKKNADFQFYATVAFVERCLLSK